MYFSYRDLKLARNRDAIILEICRGKRVLHIGAADSPHTRKKLELGLLLHHNLSDVALELVGIDLDAEAAAWVNAQALPEIRVLDMNRISELGFQPDVIVFGETIEHIVNLGACLDTLKSCMGPDTRLVISTPNCFHLWFMSMVLRNHESIHDDHKIGFTYGLLVQLLRSQGFTVSDFYFTFLPRVNPPWWRGIWFMASMFRHGVAETLLAICTLDVREERSPSSP